MQALFPLVLVLLFLNACDKAAPNVSANKEYSLLAVNYFQTASEVKALQYQAFNLAKWRLQEALKQKKPNENLAVIVDIDETMLDNSPYQARQIHSGESYPKGWNEWVEEANAQPIPGALAFMKWADSASVALFYISNRKIDEKTATIKNLEVFGFPQVTETHLLLREKESSKEARRKLIAADYKIVLLIGDNLADFDRAFDRKEMQMRNSSTDSLLLEFGKRLIVLPNPLYGDWEGAVYQNRWDRSPAQLDSLRRSALKIR